MELISEERMSKKSPELTLTWCDLSVCVKRKHDSSFWTRQRFEQIQILNNVSGVAKSGSLLAIMGGSGAGKTTLLATISRRIKGNTTGEVLINGRSIDPAFMANMSGFVPQQDLVVDSLSVREHMEFMAQLKMDRRMMPNQRKRRINSLMSELSLTKCCHTRLSALSGGEKKRLALAVQLLTDPPLLFCDEPTTGLDSYSAGVVIEKLRQFAASGKVVVCTIHQPASGLFDMFNQVLLVARGRVAFYGDVCDAAKYFNSVGLNCPATFNRADFYASQLAVVPGKEMESHRKIQWLCDEFDRSRYGQELINLVTQARNERRSIIPCRKESDDDDLQSLLEKCYSSNPEIEEDFHQYSLIMKPKYCSQLYWLTWRSLIDFKRNLTKNTLQIFLYLCVGLLISLPYLNLNSDEQTGIQNMQGLMYLIVTETIFTYTYSVFHTFPQEIPLLLREIGNGLYMPGPYYISKMIILIPRAILGPFIYTGLIFYIAGLQGGVTGFLLFCIPVISSAIAATAYGSVMSASFESVSTASLLSVPVDFISVIFSGIFIQLGNLPPHLSWIRYTSTFYFGIEAISILQWEQIIHIQCPDEPEIPCISSGIGVLNKYGYSTSNFPIDLTGLFVIYCVCHIIGFLAIWKRSKSQPVY